ncbi:hypothetical protein Avbf_16305 [Armadillidium vulgare]|nr:hypothetical protein Avbf_16305 [Armadillidium vulgare]
MNVLQDLITAKLDRLAKTPQEALSVQQRAGLHAISIMGVVNNVAGKIEEEFVVFVKKDLDYNLTVNHVNPSKVDALIITVDVNTPVVLTEEERDVFAGMDLTYETTGKRVVKPVEEQVTILALLIMEDAIIHA